MKFRTAIFVILLGLQTLAQAQTITAVQNGLKTMQNQKGLLYARVALCVYDLNTKKELIASKSNEYFIPASNTKLFTTAAALNILSPEYTFQTVVSIQGKIDNQGILQGNLIIEGGFDPSLGSEYLTPEGSLKKVHEAIKSILSKEGIKGINGKLLIDISRYPKYFWPGTWLKEDIANYYGAPISTINIADNLFRVTIKSGKEGQVADIATIQPTMSDLGYTLVNKVKYGPAGSGDKSIFAYETGTKNIIYEGTVQASEKPQAIDGAIPDPVDFFASQLAKYLSTEYKTALSWQIRSEAVKSDKLLGSIQSPSLAELCRLTNFHSLNHYAEAMQLAVNEVTEKTDTTDLLWPKSINIQEDQFYDGSGLSPKNHVTASQIVKLLSWANSNTKIKKAFINSLPVLGESGTVTKFCVGTAAAGKIIAKTGSGNGAFNLSGYVLEDGKPRYAFSLLINYPSAKFSELRTYMADVLVPLGKMGR